MQGRSVFGTRKERHPRHKENVNTAVARVVGQTLPVNLLDRLSALSIAARIVLVAVAVGAATGAASASHADVEQASLVLLVAVVCSALLGRSSGLFGAVLAAGALNLVFTPPHWTLRVGNGDDVIALITFGLIAVTVGATAIRDRFDPIHAGLAMARAVGGDGSGWSIE